MKYGDLSQEELISKIEKLENDLIDSKKTNKNLKTAEEQNRFQSSLLNAVEQAIIVTKPDGEITFWNPFAEKLYGWTAEQAIGQNILKTTTPQILHEQGAEIMNNLNNGQSWSGEFNAQHRDGKIFPAFVTDTPILNEKSELTDIIGVSMDISERKKENQNTIETQKKLLSALESMTDAVFISDINGNFVEFNEAFASFHRMKDKTECTKALKEWPKVIEVYNLDGSLLPLDK